MRRNPLACSLTIVLALALAAPAADGNRLTSLDEPCDPYWVGLNAPRLITPQWIGEEGVEAVVVLSIDDLVDRPHELGKVPEKYEKFLRPILERLKKIDGRAPVSVMTEHVNADTAHVQEWLSEGVNLETHTYTHPCPCLKAGNAAKDKDTFQRSVDAVSAVPNARPVGFRMPCCDSMNSASPRFYAELFNKTTPQGKFLSLDSSIFMLFTPKDPLLPRELVQDAKGCERLGKYIPLNKGFVNYVEDYPYPYVISRLCWEIPTVVPDDWMGFNLQKAHNPVTVADLKAALDAVVVKQGEFTLTFHPGVWIRQDQVLDLIEYAVTKYGRRVKFLNFREVYERLTKNVLGGQPLRAPNGQDAGVRVLDVNGDGYMDVVIGNDVLQQTRIWSPEEKRWIVSGFPAQLVTTDAQGNRRDAGVRFGILQKSDAASFLVRNEQTSGVWHFDGTHWTPDPQGLAGLDLAGPVMSSVGGRDRGVRLRDLDNDGLCELIVGNSRQQGIFQWSAEHHAWKKLPFSLPADTTIVDDEGRDAGLRFVDTDEDGAADVVFSNAQRYSLHLFHSMSDGWSRKIHATQRSEGDVIPMIIRADGSNNGVWFKYRHLYVQNEETGAVLPNHIDSRSYRQLIVGDIEPPARPPKASLKSILLPPGSRPN